MRPPSVVNIAGNPVAIKVKRRVLIGDEPPTDSGLLGACYFYENRIEVKSGQPASQERDAVLHEVLHALVRVSRLHHPPAPLANYDKEELVVANLTTQLLDTLRRNPRLVAYLLER